MAKHGQAPVIIKKVKKGGHGAHHGGAWKVAYADFVTAMMAFFLLLWLLNVTTDVQKRGIADYFDPSLASHSNSGAGGVLGGTAIGQPGAAKQSMASVSFEDSPSPPRSSSSQDDSDDGGDNDVSGGMGGDQDGSNNDQRQPPAKLTAEQLQKEIADREQKRFEAAKEALEQAVKEVPELQSLAKNLLIDETPEGLRIQLVDQDKQPMFPLGSAELADPAKKLLGLITQVVARMPNKISITGHTDATQYAFSAKYTNWELSADRANASRREFMADGLPAERIERVVGVADQDPLDKDNPADPQNRRISIVLLRDPREQQGQAQATASADAPSPAPATPAPTTPVAGAAAAAGVAPQQRTTP